MFDYSLLRRRQIDPNNLQSLEYDVLVAAFNSSNRVREVFNNVSASRRIWLAHSDYAYEPDELPTGEIHHFGEGLSAIEAWAGFFTETSGIDWTRARLVFDITGMMRPHIVALPLALHIRGVERADIIYTDPDSYSRGSETQFAYGGVLEVEQVAGFEGTHTPSLGEKETLVIGAGYDDELVRRVAEDKRSARHVVMLGLPSLQPHMYQESQIRLDRARESINRLTSASVVFAPADDPFMTAQVLSEEVRKIELRGEAENLYLSPVGVKTQTLGFAWYYLCERRDSPTSLIFPNSRLYSRETSRGIARVHVFTLELDWLTAGGAGEERAAHR